MTLAVLFGVRTAVLGLTLLRRSVRPTSARQASALENRPSVGGRIAVTAAALATVVVSVVAVNLHSGPPQPDAFYDAPEALPDTPGALLRTEPYEGNIPDGVSAHRILYTTTDSSGRPALASAVLAVPDTAEGPIPLIAWGHGTVGVARGCAPSIGADAISTVGIPMIDLVVERGWAVVATDYTGMGTRGDFPYLVGVGEGASILDSIRAAHDFDDATFADCTVIWGHSQGGHAAEWAGMMAPDYAPDLDIAGTAALSPASDPQAMAQRVADRPEGAGTSLRTKGTSRTCARDIPVTFAAYPDRTHMGVLDADSPLMNDLFPWTDDRFTGREAADTCLAPAG